MYLPFLFVQGVCRGKSRRERRGRAAPFFRAFSDQLRIAKPEAHRDGGVNAAPSARRPHGPCARAGGACRACGPARAGPRCRACRPLVRRRRARCASGSLRLARSGDVIAAAITVGLWRLPVSFWMMSTGRTPPCSLPDHRAEVGIINIASSDIGIHAFTLRDS